LSLIVLEGKKGEDLKQTIQAAMDQADECDGVLVLMQKRGGGLLWFAPDNMTVQTLAFYAQSFLFHIHAIMTGVLKG
jgi:hypothetical protein